MRSLTEIPPGLGGMIRSVLIVALVECSRSSASAQIVAADQVGYASASAKTAFTIQSADSFSVLDEATRHVAFRGGFLPSIVPDPSTGQVVSSGDFSGLKVPGKYLIVTSRGDSSYPFIIADTVFRGVYASTLKGFYYQRCGMALDPAYAGPYTRPACHTTSDGFFIAPSESTGFCPVAGGWHDAGDYGKYVVNAGISVGTLLLAYEAFPAQFSRDDIGIPESGNGVPDILDESRYELEWLLRMQKSDGGVFFKVTKQNFEGFVMPQNDSGQRFIYQLSSCATGDFAAVTARAARVYRPFDTLFASKCLAAARAAWSFLLAHPTIVPPGGFTNPAGTSTGQYGDGSDSDERLWAAAELFESTGEPSFNAYYQSNAPASGYISAPMAWPDVGPLAHLTYLFSAQSSASTALRSALRQSLLAECQALLNKHDDSGYRTALASGDYVWGSNSVALNGAILLLFGYRLSPATAYLDAAEDQLHYVLGANALGRSFVTGLGSRPPKQIHHRPSASDGIADPVPGLLAGGPNRYGGDPVLDQMVSSGTAPALCYRDTTPSYASNEIAINWNAPLVFLSGYIASGGGASSVRSAPRGSLSPIFRLEQNYPNPFNGGTRIAFDIPERQLMQLRIVDLLGREVYTDQMGSLSPGHHERTWDGRDRQGRVLGSGTYFYYLSGATRSAVRRLVVLR